MKTLVIIPTYNECENIPNLVPEIHQWVPDAHILVVDDSSPDGTANLVKEMAQTDDKLHLLLREKKEGLGRAYVAGFKWGMEQGYEAMVEMDADFSHRPEDLKTILSELPAVDFIVGSRWVEGGGVKNWGLGRLMISKGGSFYARLILGYPVKDWTGGFNAWKRETLEKIGLDKLRSEGYSFQIELKFRALKAGCEGKEVPIFFEDRRLGQSKMSSKIVMEAMFRVWSIRQI